MLHYLVTYVRESWDKESSDSSRSSGQMLPTHAGGEQRIDGSQQSASFVRKALLTSTPHIVAAETPGENRPLQDPVPSVPIIWRQSSTALLLLIGFSTVSVAPGCACFRREKVDANVVSARQLSLRGIDALQRGQWEDAENLFATALEKNPTDERAHRHFAEVMWHRGDHKAAIRHQEKSVRLSGGDPALLVQLGEMYLKEGNIDAAAECAQEAIDANDDLPAAWALRGDILRQRGDPTQAMESYHRALSHQPHYPHVQMSLADLYRQADRPRRQLATLSALAAQYPPDQVPQEVEFQRGLALKSLGRHQDAVDTLLAAAARGEPSADLLYHLSEAQFLAGNSANSRLALQAALTKVPNHSPSLKLRDKLERHSQAMTAAVELK